jgi:hypothetical protein
MAICDAKARPRRTSDTTVRLHRARRCDALERPQERAIAVNIAIMRTFLRLRQILETHKELAALEKQYDQKFKVVFDILMQLMEPPPEPPKRPAAS